MNVTHTLCGGTRILLLSRTASTLSGRARQTIGRVLLNLVGRYEKLAILAVTRQRDSLTCYRHMVELGKGSGKSGLWGE